MVQIVFEVPVTDLTVSSDGSFINLPFRSVVGTVKGLKKDYVAYLTWNGQKKATTLTIPTSNGKKAPEKKGGVDPGIAKLM